MTVIKIRRATITDVDMLVKLRMELLYEVGNLINIDNKTIAEANREYFLDNLPNGRFMSWIAEINREIVGASGLLIYQRPPVAGNISGLEGYIMNMYTIPEMRGRGVASLLVEAIINYVKSTEAKRIFLHAAPTVQALYKKHGFQKTGSEMELIL